MRFISPIKRDLMVFYMCILDVKILQLFDNPDSNNYFLHGLNFKSL